MVEVWQAIVFDGDDREPLLDGCVNNFLFAFGDAGRDKDGSFGSGREALLFLKKEGRFVFAVANNWEQACGCGGASAFSGDVSRVARGGLA